MYGKGLLSGEKWLKIIPGFFTFCLLSSAIYVINDVKDKNKDKNHPTKCNRPIASGEIKVKTAVTVSIILLLGSIALNAVAFSHWTSYLILGLYFRQAYVSVSLLNYNLLFAMVR